MTTVFLALCFVLAWGGVAADAADQNNASAAPQQTRQAPDLLFGEPRGSIGVRASWVFAREGGDLFEFIQKQLTINEGDFDAPAFAVDVGLAVSPRADVLFGFEFSDAETRSEYRDYVDSNRRPITQETGLREANLSGSVRIALMPRGRRVSRLAWIPRRAAPYAGAGGGLLWYRVGPSSTDSRSPRSSNSPASGGSSAGVSSQGFSGEASSTDTGRTAEPR